MAKNRKNPKLHFRSSMISRRQFIKVAVATTASVGAASWSHGSIFAAQPARKRIVIHGERQVTSLGYHNRRETEHVSM
ncbi:MAG TPA: twin-arginine translocation signal domain-containing protein, partial [Candidatus Binatia bacterium]|nr:twin-arginine translocation signal domain-containing protein [Candidatus Binatia bacterium]